MFLSRLKQELKIPVLAFVDSDPYGLKILSVYMSGSKAMSYDSASLTTPDIKWLGATVRPRRHALSVSIARRKRTSTWASTLKEEFVLKNPAWVRELAGCSRRSKRPRSVALSALGFQSVTASVYLPAN